MTASRSDEKPTGSYPQPASTLPYWRTDPHVLDDHRSTAELPSTCEILIIGAGYAGAATAYHLFENNPSAPSTVILDARQACSGATGRNGGHLRPEVYFNMSTYIAHFGALAAAEVSNFETAHVQALKDLVEENNIDCDFTVTRSFDVLLDEQQAQHSKTAYNKLLEAGLEGTRDAHYTGPKNTEVVCGVKGAKACFSFTAAHLWPYKLVMWFLAAVVAKGVNLQTHTPVTHVESEADTEGFYTVTTTRGSIRARKIVHATNGFSAGILPEYTNAIVPNRSICSRVKAPEGQQLPYLTNTYSIRQGPGKYDYLIPGVDGSVIVGGATSAYRNNRELWYGVSDDSKLIEPAAHYFDGYMQRTFRGWEQSNAVTDKVWTGITAATPDLLPHIGRVPSRSNQFILAGFNGHGMPVGFLAAKGIAQMLRDESVSFEQTGIPRIFETTARRLERADENGRESNVRA